MCEWEIHILCKYNTNANFVETYTDLNMQFVYYIMLIKSVLQAVYRY